jgi:signal transduction histidine kinase
MSNSPVDPMSKSELKKIRSGLDLLRKQANINRVETDLLVQQLDRAERLLQHLDQEKPDSRFKALYNVSRMLGSSLDLQVVLDQVMDAIIQLTGAERGFLMLRDDDGEIVVWAARNFDRQTLGDDKTLFSRTIANQVLDTGKSVVTVNAGEDPRFSSKASVLAQSLLSVMATPLRTRDRVIGVAYVDSSATVGLFEDDDLAALDTFSAQAAIALDNARLFSATDEALRKRVEELSQLRRIDLRLNKTLDADQAVAYTLESACQLSEASGGCLGLVEGDDVRLAHCYGSTKHASFNDLETRFPQVLDVVKDGKTLLYAPKTGNVSHVLVTPILREAVTIGVVILVRADGKTFSAEQQDMVDRVIARAAVAIENARLYAAVQAANVAKSEFVGIVAHDLKAPMTGIRGYSDLLLMIGGLNEEQTDFVNTIIETVERMEVLVSDLADISRIEGGDFSMFEVKLPVMNVVKAVKNSLLPQIKARKHTFVENIEADLPDIWVDYHRLLQVLTNLLSNANKYTREGGTITLDVKKVDKRVQFSVADTGIGLSEDSLKNLGKKFWRANDHFTLMQPGTGLGFAIAKTLVGQMDSKLDVWSQVGKGSRFTFSVAIVTDENK